MSDINTNLAMLARAVYDAQASLSAMQGAVTSLAEQIGDTEKQAAQIESDIGKAGVNMRDAIVKRLLGLGVNPVQIVGVQQMQIQMDSKGTFLRDAQNNFIAS